MIEPEAEEEANGCMACRAEDDVWTDRTVTTATKVSKTANILHIYIIDHYSI